MSLHHGGADAPRPKRRHAREETLGTGLLPRTLFALALGAAPLVGCAPYAEQVGAIGDSLGDEPSDLVEGDAGDGTGKDVKTGNANDPSAGAHHISNEAMLELIRNYDYRGPDFTLINPEPFPSTVAPGKSVSLWVSNEGADALASVVPEVSGSEADVPVGTVIVREVLNDYILETITVMVKLPDGAFPLGGDFWWAATDPQGVVKQTADGSPVIGLLEDCGTCHLRRSHDGFLFGTPRAYLPD